MWFDEFKTPIGRLRVAVDESGLRYVLFENNKYLPNGISEWRPDRGPTEEAREQINRYLSGEIREFTLPFRLAGTEFQQRTWKHLAYIPFGKTWSYAELAEKVGSPKAIRAVGSANGRNPLPIVLPCHRVIGSNGSLTGNLRLVQRDSGLFLKALLPSSRVGSCHPQTSQQLPQ